MLQKKINWIEKVKNLEKEKFLTLVQEREIFYVEAKTPDWQIFGVEPNPGARKLASKKGVDLVENITSLPNNYFDVITMWHVLEHVPDLDKQIKELDRLLKPDGLACYRCS